MLLYFVWNHCRLSRIWIWYAASFVRPRVTITPYTAPINCLKIVATPKPCLDCPCRSTISVRTIPLTILRVTVTAIIVEEKEALEGLRGVRRVVAARVAVTGVSVRRSWAKMSSQSCLSICLKTGIRHSLRQLQRLQRRLDKFEPIRRVRDDTDQMLRAAWLCLPRTSNIREWHCSPWS